MEVEVTQGHRIKEVIPGSIADEVGIEPGDRLISVNGKELTDIIDYIDFSSENSIEILVIKENGEEWIIELEKEDYEDLGLVFDQYLLSPERKCGNNCIFCFVDQLPNNLRSSLYYKDDDWRLSFLMGNFITLTNMSDKDVHRIISKQLSPLYISVHTTNPQLRSEMLGNKRGGEVLKYLDMLCEANIRLHCQIVLCRGWNDGAELDRTISDLWRLNDCIESLAVVPVGLTSHREGLTAIEQFDEASANAVIDQIEQFQGRFRGEKGKTFVFAADEFYVLAKRNFPAYEVYEDFPQIENGVGLVVRFVQEFDSAMELFADSKPESKRITIVTGVSAYEIMAGLAQRLEKAFNITVQVIPVRNHFFGERVTVAGLVTGGDICSALQGMELGDKVLIPQVMLRKGADTFLDDVTLEQLQDNLKIPVYAVPVDGYQLINSIIGNN